MSKKYLLKYIIPFGLCISLQSYAQQSIEEEEVVNIEGLYSSPPAQAPVPPQDEANSATANAQTAPTSSEKTTVEALEEVSEQEKARLDIKKQDVKDLKDLSKLSPFSEVSVIQKKYMPKTGRFQFFVGPSLMTNTPWYNNAGGKLSLSYNFTETMALELNGHFLSNSERDAAKEIKENNGLKAEQFIYTKSYYGLDFVWSPIYGKMTSLDDNIIPFDMYFSIGGGTSTTNSKEEQNSTFHFGVGQIYALSKSMAFRWDYSFNAFNATPVASSDTPNPQENSYNDLLFSVGLSFFFPEAGYR